MKTKETELKKNLFKAFEELNNYWQGQSYVRTFDNNYPFTECFDELTQKVKEWQNENAFIIEKNEPLKEWLLTPCQLDENDNVINKKEPVLTHSDYEELKNLFYKSDYAKMESVKIF